MSSAASVGGQEPHGGGGDGGTYTVAKAYDPEHEGEIELIVGDRIKDVKDLTNGWTLGRNVTRHCVGIFPTTYITPDSPDKAAIQNNANDDLWEKELDILDEYSGTESPASVKHNSPRPKDFINKKKPAPKLAPKPHKKEPPKVSPRAVQVAIPTVPDLQPQKVSTPPASHRSTHQPRATPPTQHRGTPTQQRQQKGTPPPSYRGTPPPSRAQGGPHTYERLKRRDGTPVRKPNNATEQDLELGPFNPEDYASSSLPSPKKGKYSVRKPQLLVRPNPGKNLFHQNSDTSMKMTNSEQELPQSGSSRSNTPPSTHSTPPVMRTRQSAPPGQLPALLINEPETPRRTDRGQSDAGPDVHASTSGVPPLPLESPDDQDLNSPSDMSSPVSPSIEATEQQNMANETMNQDSPRIRQKLREFANKRQYYQDYRTLECPPAGMETPKMRYKPILKNKNGQYGSGNNRANEIYYRQEDDTQRSMRMCVAILAGLVFGCIMFLWMYYGLEYDFMIALLVCCVTALILCFLFAISRLCRCIAALLLPSLCTTRGRLAFLIIITGFVLDGPITNIYFNMAEVSRSMSCSAEQSYNQSLLLLRPFDAMMGNLNRTVLQLQHAAHDVDAGLEPLNNGLGHVELDVYGGKLELTGTRQTCRKMIDRAFNECAQGIMDAQNQCLGVVVALGDFYHIARHVLEQLNPERFAAQHVALQKRQVFGPNGEELTMPDTKRDVCEPLESITVCQSLNDSEVLCQPEGWAGMAIHDAINATMRAMTNMQSTLHFQVNPEPYYSARLNASRVVYSVRQNVQYVFYSRTQYFELVITILKKIIPIAILLLIYVTYLHVKNYVSKDTYDNVYVTSQFKTLDQKRSEVAGENILPLKKYERNYLIDTTLSELSPPEDGLYRIGLCVLLLHLVLSITCYLFDYILYWILALIRKHGDPKLDFTGKDSMEYVITGEGVISDLLLVFLRGFHPANLFGYTLDVHACLPKPHTPSIMLLLVIFILYFVLILTILFKAYLLRIRNRITAYFYPEREKARIVHLYNVVLNHRYRMPKLLQQRAKMSFRERQMREHISVCHRMAAKLPPCKVFVYKQAKCLVCQSEEDHTFRDCQTDLCQGAYCAECWEDLGRICPLCHQVSEYSDDEDYEDLEDDLQPYYRSSKIYV